MIWITTLLMLVIAAVFVREALREKRQYLELGKDPETMADEGLFMETVGKLAPAKNDPAPTLQEDDSLFAGLTRRVASAENPVSRLMEKKSHSSSQATNDGLFDRVNQKISGVLDSADNKLDGVRQRAGEKTANTGLIDRIGGAVARAEGKIDSMVSRKTQRMADSDEAGLVNTDSRMGKLVSGVSKRLDKVETRIERKLEATREHRSEDSQDTDIVSRIATKIGRRVDDIDDKLVAGTRKLTERGQ